MDTSQQSLSVGYILQNGKYKIVRFINSGGFGCTYEAIHTVFETRVAIKEFFVKDFCNRDEASHVSVGTNSKVSQFNKLKRSLSMRPRLFMACTTKVLFMSLIFLKKTGLHIT